MSVNKTLGFCLSTCIHPGNEGQAHLPAETGSLSRINHPATPAPQPLLWVLFPGNAQFLPRLPYPAAWRPNGSRGEGGVINHQQTTTRWLSADIATSSCRAAGSVWATSVASVEMGARGSPQGLP